MIQINYVREHMAFMEYAADNNLRSAEVLVWEALFHIMNQHARGNGWPDGYVRIKNERLMFYAPVSFDAFNRARKKLTELGLISYIPGIRNSEVPMYRMHYLTGEGRDRENGDGGMPPAPAAKAWPDRNGDSARSGNVNRNGDADRSGNVDRSRDTEHWVDSERSADHMRQRNADGNVEKSPDRYADKNADSTADKHANKKPAKDRHQYINYNQKRNETKRNVYV